MNARMIVMVVAVVVPGSAMFGQTHAPWPVNWNDWSDPALWVTVGNPGNAPDDTGYGRVDYSYRMGKFEVTAGQYCEFLNAVAKTDTYGLYNSSMDYDTRPDQKGCNIRQSSSSGSYTYSVPADWANRPVNWISWFDAARFCNWLANGQPTGGQDQTTTEDGSYRLNGSNLDATRKPNARYVIPDDDEWYKAAYYDPSKPGGAGYWEYPTSTNAVPSNDLSDPDPGNNANFEQGGYTIGSPYYRTAVGDFENSESPYGTFDQAGNLWEWNEPVSFAANRCVQGGLFNTSASLLAAQEPTPCYPGYEYFSIGLRVADVPEPATLSLLALGGLALLRRRRPA